MKSRRKSDFLSSRVQYISLAQLSPNPQQPRRSFDEDSLSELAESIRRYGILQPLTVRRTAAGWELVAGERRLRPWRRAPAGSMRPPRAGGWPRRWNPGLDSRHCGHREYRPAANWQAAAGAHPESVRHAGQAAGRKQEKRPFLLREADACFQ